jgi:hypothetical protein
MSSIAIIQLTDKHTEVLGGMLTLFGDLFKHIHIYYKSYASDYANYYKNELKSSSYTVYLHDLNKDSTVSFGKHNLYVFMTGMEYVDEYDKYKEQIDAIPCSKVLLLSHHADEYNELKDLPVGGIFAISPVYKKEKVPYFLTYSDMKKPIKSMHNDKINILLSGFTNPHNKDLRGFIHMLRQFHKYNITAFKFHVVNYYPIPQFEEYGDLCKVYVDLKAAGMMRLLSRVEYVMTLTKKNSSYHKKQLTGIIPLAVSMGVPLIIDKDLANIYRLSSQNCIVYDYPSENSFQVVKETVLSLMSRMARSNRYKKLRKAMYAYRDRMIQYYKNKMKKYVQKVMN